MDAVIEVDGLVKRYGGVDAVAGIDLRVERGEVFAMLGPNGAGKTTTVEILEGYRRPSGGSVRVLGQAPATADDAWRSRIGIVHQETSLPVELTANELLAFQAALYPAPIAPARALELVGLTDQADKRCHTLSGGQQRRLQVALGVIGDPELIFLDEPTTGLDPEARRDAWSLVEDLIGSGKTVLLTTHYLEEAERLADRLAVIVGGRIVAEGSPATLGGRNTAAATVSFHLPPGIGSPPDLGRRMSAPRTGADDATVRFETDQPTADIAALAAWTAANGHPELPELVITRRSLEDTYLDLVAEHTTAADGSTDLMESA